MTKKFIFLLNFWLPPILWAMVIFIFSAFPTGRATQLFWPDFLIKKTAHMVEYAILTLLLFRAFKNGKLPLKKAFSHSFLLAIFYAFTDEFHQRFTPGREGTLRDIIFDTIGSGLAIYFIWKLLPKAPKELKALAKNWQLL